MAFNRLLFDAVIVLYALSIVLFFVDALQPRRSVNRTALILLFVVFICETLFLFNRLEVSGTVPIYTPFDAMLLLSWLILTMALVVNAFFRIDLFLFFANVVGFALVAFDAFGFQSQLNYARAQGDLLILHISFALFSYVAFAFAFAFSIMYLIQDKVLREKRFNYWFIRLPPLERLDTYTFRSILVGFPLLLIAIVLGLIWSRLTLGHLILFDVKPLFTVGLWLMYGAYLLVRLRSGWGAPKLIWFNILCFFGVIVNMALIGFFSVYHHAL
jgi:HemX protein